MRPVPPLGAGIDLKPVGRRGVQIRAFCGCGGGWQHGLLAAQFATAILTAMSEFWLRIQNVSLLYAFGD